PFAYSQGTSTLCITRSRYSSSATPPTRFYPLSLHDALPISGECLPPLEPEPPLETTALGKAAPPHRAYSQDTRLSTGRGWAIMRSEEHTSELQSRFDLVCRLLLEKKNAKTLRTPFPGLLHDLLAYLPTHPADDAGAIDGHLLDSVVQRRRELLLLELFDGLSVYHP